MSAMPEPTRLAAGLLDLVEQERARWQVYGHAGGRVVTIVRHPELPVTNEPGNGPVPDRTTVEHHHLEPAAAEYYIKLRCVDYALRRLRLLP